MGRPKIKKNRTIEEDEAEAKVRVIERLHPIPNLMFKVSLEVALASSSCIATNVTVNSSISYEFTDEPGKEPIPVGELRIDNLVLGMAPALTLIISPLHVGDLQALLAQGSVGLCLVLVRQTH